MLVSNPFVPLSLCLFTLLSLASGGFCRWRIMLGSPDSTARIVSSTEGLECNPISVHTPGKTVRSRALLLHCYQILSLHIIGQYVDPNIQTHNAPRTKPRQPVILAAPSTTPAASSASELHRAHLPHATISQLHVSFASPAEPDVWSVGLPRQNCSFCGANMWPEERISRTGPNNIMMFGLCCMSGKVTLPLLLVPPPLLMLLLDGCDEISVHYQKHIRSFNGIFSFTSVAGKIQYTINKGSAPPMFVISGQNYHSIGSLMPDPSCRPRFAQLYFFDPDNEVQNRINAVRHGNEQALLDTKIVTDLRDMLDSHNSLARMFRYAAERFSQDSTTPLQLRLIKNRDTDGRRYNLPSASEVAALIVGDFDQENLARDVIIETHSKLLKRIDVNHPQYLALQYPLLFPYGEDGFRTGISISEDRSNQNIYKRETISMREFFSYRLQMRSNESQVILKSRRLFQQFLVDSYTMVEAERLQYHRHHQNKFRSHQLQGLHECLIQGETQAAKTGKRVILPSSFVGGPRYMYNNCKDAFAICRYAGYPSYFITITCNPEWTEIKDCAANYSLKPSDRPDIICRVFKIKLDELLKDLKNGTIFGKPKAIVYTVEFQKRGLPHCHILLFIQPNQKPQSSHDIDQHISAEIPEEHLHPKLHKLVQKFMVHGPCGVSNASSPCMVNGKCFQFYPVPYRETTVIDSAGFPKYRRPDNGRLIRKKHIDLNNRFIVPYNATLLLKYGCHINVEYTCQTSAIKYLFKYVHKGNDCVIASFFRSHDADASDVCVDEIQNYYDCRYISACEASWRLFGFEIQFKEPSVIRLPFHLPNVQHVLYQDQQLIENVIDNAASKDSMFLGWMRANREFHTARNLTFAEMPTYFVWDKQGHMWKPRKQGHVIGRLTHIPQSHGAEYYLRLLLNYQKGCGSFADIRTVNDVVYDTFKEGCYALGLLQDDKKFIDAINEASSWASPIYVRRLFAMLLMSNNIARPQLVWEQCWQHCVENIIPGYRQTPGVDISLHQLKSSTLAKVEQLLQTNGRTLKEFADMPFPDSLDSIEPYDTDFFDDLNFNRTDLAVTSADLVSRLNRLQCVAYDTICNAVSGTVGGFFFVYGYGGTGKTFLWNALSASIQSKGQIVLNVASSGIASLLLPNGRTAHSRFKVPLSVNQDSVCNIKQDTSLACLISAAKLIIWDEAPMLNKYCFEALDKCFKDILRFSNGFKPDAPFGGKVVVLGGDFRQILPVIPRGSREDIVHACINSSYLWHFCKVLRLTINMRLHGCSQDISDAELKDFADWILNLGDGLLGDHSDGESMVRIPEKLLLNCDSPSLHDLVLFVYPDILFQLSSADYFKDRGILAPTIDVVTEVNNHVMSLLPGNERVYLSSDTLLNEDSHMEFELYTIRTESLNALNCSGIPQHKLVLKIGVPVMLLRNIDQSNGLCNGTRMEVRRLGDHVIECVILAGRNIGQVVLIPRLNMIPNNETLPIRFARRQFPIMLCFAMTINKSQGQTLSTVGVYLPRPVFTHGHLYVALSRVNRMSGLKILIVGSDGTASNHTTNVVYRKVFVNLF